MLVTMILVCLVNMLLCMNVGFVVSDNCLSLMDVSCVGQLKKQWQSKLTKLLYQFGLKEG